ncbi:MAG: sigma-70 family RNA polymerase sigma factor [Planctomycetota bacterium]
MSHDGGSTSHLDALVAESDWLRGLARQLALDEATADDLVQETSLAYQQSAPATTGGVRGWLATVTRNFARRGHRTRERRTRREQRVAPREAVTPDDLLEVAELQRTVARAVYALAEPYRTTIVLRFYEGWSPTEIAKRTDTPAPTVRVRLKRALEQLRLQLDRDLDQPRHVWSAAALALIDRWPAGASAALSSSSTTLTKWIVVMSAPRVAGGVAVLLLALFFAWQASTPGIERVDTGSSSESIVTADDASPPTTRTPEPAHPVAETDARAAAPPAAQPTRTESADEPQGVATIRARFLDGGGEPVPGVFVELPRRSGSHTTNRLGPSDEDGWIEVEVPAAEKPRMQVLRSSAQGYAAELLYAQLAQGQTENLGDVTLSAGGVIHGIVVDSRNMPIADARVYVTRPNLRRENAEHNMLWGPTMNFGARAFPARTDDGGYFEYEGVPRGVLHVVATAAGLAWGSIPDIRLRSQDEVISDLRVVVPPLPVENTLRGRVRFPDGVPVDAALIELRKTGDEAWQWGQRRSDVDGEFLFHVEAGVSYEVRATDPSGVFPPRVASAQGGAGRVDITFVASRWMQLYVQTRSGAELPDYEILLWPAGKETGYDTLARSRGAAQGKVARESIGDEIQIPLEPFTIEIRVRDHIRQLLGPYAPADAPPTMVCLVDPLARVAGVVSSPQGRVPGARIYLSKSPPPDRHFVAYGFPQRFSGYSDRESAGFTDSKGRFDLAVHKEGNYFLYVQADGYAPTDVTDLDLGPRQGRDNIRVRMAKGGSVAGRVISPSGELPENLVIAVSRGDMNTHTTEPDEQGNFKFDGLAPGKWMIKRLKPGGIGNIIREREGAIDFPWAFTIRDQQTTHYDLLLDE